MASFNKVILMGRLTATPEPKQTPSGISVTTFTLAVDRNTKDAPCDFISIVAWRQTADFVCKYFKKGQAMLVCGEIQTRTWTDNQGNKRVVTEVVANEVRFCESKSNFEGNSLPHYQNGSKNQNTPSFEAVNSDDDLPF